MAMYGNKPVFTKAKAIAAGIGSTCTAIIVFITLVGPMLADDKIDAGEAGGLVAAFISLVGTVYAVWRVRNKPVPGKTEIN